MKKYRWFMVSIFLLGAGVTMHFTSYLIGNWTYVYTAAVMFPVSVLLYLVTAPAK